jgi:hypothetical protein
MDRPPPLNESEVLRFEHYRDASLETVDVAVRLAVPEDTDETAERGPAQIVEVRELVEGDAKTFVAIVHRLGHPERDPLIRVSRNYTDRLGRAGAAELTDVARRWWEKRSGVPPRAARGRR